MKKAPPPPWFEFAVLDDQDRPIANVANAIAALRHVPELRDLLSYDEMKGAVLIEGGPPAPHRTNSGANAAAPRLLTDGDVITIQEFMQHAGLPRIGREIIRDAVTARARERAFHPLRDYLVGLKWDGRRRLDRWLATYLGVDDGEYATVIGRMFLISAVARALSPGVKVDHMLILQGEQGDEKSKVCAVLGGKWYSDDLPSLRDKDSKQFLRGKWIVEIPELSSFKGVDLALLKAYITRSTENYRPSYGARFVEEPRQTVFIGTTNEDAFLTDETGNRRYWPAFARKVDIPALTADRDQLFAESVAAFRGGEQWWPDKNFERSVIRTEQDARLQADPWREIIAPYIDGLPSVLVGDVAVRALGIEKRDLGTKDSLRIGKVLTSLGYRRSDKKNGSGHRPYLKT